VKILDSIVMLLATACQAGSACVSTAIMKAAKRVCMMAWLLVVALVLVIGALGLMAAALFIVLSPCLGAHWAAMIVAGAALAGSGIFMAVANRVSKGH
jgi:hypothetical protein